MSDMREFEENSADIAEYESRHTEDAELVIIAHGIVFRAVREAVDNLRRQSLSVGSLQTGDLATFTRRPDKGTGGQSEKNFGG